MTVFSEHQPATTGEPLAQGDIIEAVDQSASFWERDLLVITADCDLTHGKHQGRVTCVPLLTADEYLLETQVPRIREKFLTAKLLPTLRNLLDSNGAPKISDERLRCWPREADISEITRALDLRGDPALAVQSCFEAIRILYQQVKTLDEAVENLVAAQLSDPNPKKRENVLKSIISTLKAPYSSPPGDALFISALSPAHSLGYFVYLRHLEQVWQQDIATGPTHKQVRYRRISRLKERYTHNISQRFALVFMSIGLPDDYEENRDIYSDLLEMRYQ